MSSPIAPDNWSQQLADCLNGRQQQVLVFEKDDAISLHCNKHQLLLHVQLTRTRFDIYPLQAWLRLGQASLAHFDGALALSPVTGDLWLVQGLPRDSSQSQVLSTLEALLNQRDTWRSLVARLARPGRKLQAIALRTPLH